MDSKSSLNKTIEKLNQLPNRNRNAFKNIYYTQPNTMNVAAEWIKKHIKCSSNYPLKVVDFSAGDGLFGKTLASVVRHINYIGVDIEPTDPSVEKCDFLNMPYTQYQKLSNPDVIGFNPPFGREGRDAIRFMQIALTLQPKWMIVILPFRPWSMSNIFIMERLVLEPNSFFTIEDGMPFSTASEMLLLQCDYRESIPSIIERKEFPFVVTDTRKKEFEGPHFTNSMLLLRKVGWYAGKHCYAVSSDKESTNDNRSYKVNYISSSSIGATESFSDYGVVWPTNLTPWGKRGHIVCYKDEAVSSSRGGQGFLKVYFPIYVDHKQAVIYGKKIVNLFCEQELAFGTPKSINCAIVRSILNSMWNH